MSIVKPIYLFIFIGIITLLNGCGAPKYQEISISLRHEMMESFKRGDLVLDCQFDCLWSQLSMKEKQHNLFLQQKWEELAISVMQVGMKMDLCYFYLGAAAEGLGYNSAAKKYYEQSYDLLLNGQKLNKCKDDFTCNSIQLTVEIPKRMELIATDKGSDLKKHSPDTVESWGKCRDKAVENVDYYEIGEEEYLKIINRNCGEQPPPYISSQKEAIGLHPHDLIRTSFFRDRFIQLLGNDFDNFVHRLEVASPTSLENGWIVGEGNAPHRGGADWAAFAINSRTNKIFAVMASSGRGYQVPEGYLDKYGFKSWKNAPPFLSKRCKNIANFN